MPRTKLVLSENALPVADNEIDERMFTPEGEWETQPSMEALLSECGLTFEDFYRNNYE